MCGREPMTTLYSTLYVNYGFFFFICRRLLNLVHLPEKRTAPVNAFFSF